MLFQIEKILLQAIACSIGELSQAVKACTDVIALLALTTFDWRA
jgi:hypothetical protein